MNNLIMISRHYAYGAIIPGVGIYTAADYEVPLVVVRPNARHCAMLKKMSIEL